MNRRCIGEPALLFLGTVLLTQLLLAKGFWESRPFNEWTLAQATNLLTKSPWATRVSLGAIHPGATPLEAPKPSAGCRDCPQATSDVAQLNPLSEERPPREEVPVRYYEIRFVSALPIRMAIGRIAVLKGLATEEEVAGFVKHDPFGDRWWWELRHRIRSTGPSWKSTHWARNHSLS